MDEEYWTATLHTGVSVGSNFGVRGSTDRPPEEVTAADLISPAGSGPATVEGRWILVGFNVEHRTAQYDPKDAAPSPKEQYREQVIEEELSDWGEGARRDLLSD